MNSLSKNGKVQTPALKQCQRPRVAEDRWEMIKHVTLIVHFISNLMPPLSGSTNQSAWRLGTPAPGDQRSSGGCGWDCCVGFRPGGGAEFSSVRRRRVAHRPDAGDWPRVSSQDRRHLELRHGEQRFCGHTALLCYVQPFLCGNSNSTCYLQGLCTQPTIGKKTQLLLLFCR